MAGADACRHLLRHSGAGCLHALAGTDALRGEGIDLECCATNAANVKTLSLEVNLEAALLGGRRFSTAAPNKNPPGSHCGGLRIQEFTDSPGLAQRSIQNTPEPGDPRRSHQHSLALCHAGSSLNHPMLGLPPLRRAFREAKLVVWQCYRRRSRRQEFTGLLADVESPRAVGFLVTPKWCTPRIGEVVLGESANGKDNATNLAARLTIICQLRSRAAEPLGSLPWYMRSQEPRDSFLAHRFAGSGFPGREALGGHINGKDSQRERKRCSAQGPRSEKKAKRQGVHGEWTHYRTSSLEAEELSWRLSRCLAFQFIGQESRDLIEGVVIRIPALCGQAPGPGPQAKSQGRKRDTVEVQELAGQEGTAGGNGVGRAAEKGKYLQRQLVKGTGAAVDVILEEVENEIAHMMCDSYGNYLCSAAFQACSQRQRKRMLEKLGPEVVAIACDKRGTHALQALILLLQLKEEQLQLMNSIKDNVIELSPGLNQKALKFVNTRVPERVEQALDLVQGPYGNYAIQHALEEWGGQRCQPVLQKLEGRMMQLSIQKYSSNVVEKLFSSAPLDFRERFIAELLETEKMSVLVNSNYGHYVVKRALQLATPEQSQALLEAIKTNLAMLPNRRLRVKWERVMSGKGDPDECMPQLPEPEKVKRAKPRGRRRISRPSEIETFARAMRGLLLLPLCAAGLTLSVLDSTLETPEAGEAEVAALSAPLEDRRTVSPKSLAGQLDVVVRSFCIVGVAEIFDKTWFVALICALNYGQKLAFCGAFLALALHVLLAAVLGAVLESLKWAVLPDFTLLTEPYPYRWACIKFNHQEPTGFGFHVSIYRSGNRDIFWAYSMFGNRFRPGVAISQFFSIQALCFSTAAVFFFLACAYFIELLTAESDDVIAERSSEAKETLGEKKDSDWKDVFWRVFLAVFIAEWGDRTQVAMITLHSSAPWLAVCLGSVLAFLVLTLSAVCAASLVQHAKLSERFVLAVSAGSFLLFAVLALRDGFAAAKFR
ncbi:unnamed protein product [Effrenium voratum]|nr:unnamed protein product [Effrenium voratum]